MSSLPTVAVIVVGTNERRWLESCLESVCDSDTDGFTLRVYYVDNASADGSFEYVSRAFTQVAGIANGSNLGFAGANNIGIQRALVDGADYVFLVNPDTNTPAALIGGLVRFMEEWVGYGIVGPLQCEYTSGQPVSAVFNKWTCIALAAGESHVFANDLAGLPPHSEPPSRRAPGTLEHAYVQGAALFARARVLREVGVFDEVFGTYYEEIDLCRRARLAGWRVALLTGLTIGHHGGGGTSGSAYRRRLMMRNKYYYLATDVEISRSAQARIALRWLGRDLQGKGVGGNSSIHTAVAETAQAMGWLIRQSRAIVRRRALHRAIRHR